MKFRRKTSEGDERQSHLTALIDVVFLLLIFFVMTFKVVVSEGDFHVRAPEVAKGLPSADQTFQVPLQIELTAGRDGQLTGISLQGQPVRDTQELADAVRSLVQLESESSDGAAAVIHCDPMLRYEHTIEVVGAIRGPSESPLIEKIRLEGTGT